MHLEFEDEIVKDFKAFSGEHQVRLDAPGVTFVRGINESNPRLTGNGVAKSTFWDALCWCLFGRTPGGLRNPDVIPWNECGKPSVTVHYHADGKAQWVQRSITPSKLRLNNKDISQDGLEQALGFGFDLFINTVLLAQGKALFFDRTPSEKMALFSDTLQLERWDRRSELAGKKANDEDREAEACASDIRTAQARIEETTTNLQRAKENAESWAAAQRTKKRYDTAKTAELRTKLDAKEQAMGEAQLALDGAVTELRALRGELEQLTIELREARSAFDKATLEVETKKARLKQLREDEVALAMAKACPTCGQAVTPKDLQKHRAELKREIERLFGEVGRGVATKVANGPVFVQTRIHTTEEQLNVFQVKADAARDAADRIAPELGELKAQYRQASEAQKEETVNPHNEQIATFSQRLKDLDRDKVEAEADLVHAQRTAELYRFWTKGFKDIKLQLIDDVLGELELATNSMIEEVGLVDWRVRYDVERENKGGTVSRMLNVEISSPGSRGFVKWESWSGGEQQRLRLIGALALADVLLAHAGVEVNLEILDEPALYWSSEGVQELCAFLAERARTTNRSIFYVEHNAVESSHFSRVITVARNQDGAYIRDER